ncbi:MAG: sodium dependent phosphate transporter [Planctomycetota bacterium]|nr:MAG: sodium dependent phosphate transporter [Planctomycetota bacterium]
MALVATPKSAVTEAATPLWWRVLRLGVLFSLLFLAVGAATSALHQLGLALAGQTLTGIAHPLAGLGAGILATVVVQSSSFTTSAVVAMVAAGSLPFQQAVPVIMGANIGTTVTNLLVAAGYWKRKQYLEQAVAGAITHGFFNLLAVAILFPIELMTGWISSAAKAVATGIFSFFGSPSSEAEAAQTPGWADSMQGIIAENFGIHIQTSAAILLALAFVVLLVVILRIPNSVQKSLLGGGERALNASMGPSLWTAMAVGLVLTSLMQSSSMTTSLMVPLCACGVLGLQQTYRFCLGANLGTTVTALFASLATNLEGTSIAMVHLLFNLAAVVLILGLPFLRDLPVAAAATVAKQISRRPSLLPGYLLVTFLLIPAILLSLF